MQLNRYRCLVGTFALVSLVTAACDGDDPSPATETADAIDAHDTFVATDTAAEPIDTASDAVVASGNCRDNGTGTCMPAMRSSFGFTVDCGAGRVTTAGEQTWSGPGTDLTASGSISAGCEPQEAGGGEATFFGCCLAGVPQ